MFNGSRNSTVNYTVVLAIFLMLIILMMILPVPPIILDIGLAASFALAILIFTVTLFIERPLDFSSFPTILLASLMLRLSLNVSSTKLIIGDGHSGTSAAGHVIEGFAFFVMGGSTFLGLVVFCVLLVVNFLVITKGATRMAEVGARFALDAMPGKQLAIDSDVSAGSIDHQEAKRRRDLEQRETTFFGSLDGASKFVKGDAIAGLVITILNLCAGLIMGVAIHNMSFGAAFQTYAILTVGDGLVSQIPAVIISIASALLLSRGGNLGTTDSAVFSQLGSHPMALATVGVILFVFSLVPGLPFIPFTGGSALLFLTAYLSRRKQRADEALEIDRNNDLGTPEPRTESIGDMLELDDIHVEFAPNLVDMVLDPGTGLESRIANIRAHVAAHYGLILPEIRLTDHHGLEDGTYSIRVHGVEQARARLESNCVLALEPDESFSASVLAGVETVDPVFGAPAKWIAPSEQEEASLEGSTIITPAEILATHLLETIKKNLSRLLTLKTLRRIFVEMVNLSDPKRSEANQKLLDEMIPDRVPVDVLHAVLRLLLEEQVSIRNLPLILEATAEARGMNARPEAICEHVRQRLGFQIVAGLRRDDGTVPLLQLAPEWEDHFVTYQLDTDRGTEVALPPELFNRLSNNIEKEIRGAHDSSSSVAIVASSKRRRFLNTVTRSRGLATAVLSYEEVGLDANPAIIGQVAA